MTNYEDVGEFHHKFDLPSSHYGNVRPQMVSNDLMLFRIHFLEEELQELKDAVGYETTAVYADDTIVKVVSSVSNDWDLAEVFDALLDITYVAMGTSHLFGFPWEEGWDEVQRANITKVRAARQEDSKRGSIWDVVKPPGWVAPNVGGVLENYGWTLAVADKCEHFDEVRVSRQYVVCTDCDRRRGSWAKACIDYSASLDVIGNPDITLLRKRLRKAGLVVSALHLGTSYGVDGVDNTAVHLEARYEVRGNWPRDIQTKLSNALTEQRIATTADDVRVEIRQQDIDMVTV